MRSSFGLLLLLLVAGCGGSTTVGTGPAPDDEPVPATPLPSTQASTDGPAGYVTLFSVDDQVFALPRFVAKEASRTTSGSTAPCSLSRGRDAPETEPEVSAGLLSFDVATRDGSRSFEAMFDPKEHRYAPASMQARVEPGGLLRFGARGDDAPAFDATLQASANVVFDVPGVVELDASSPRDVPIRWYTEGNDDEVFVDLSIGDNSVTCLFASSAGSATIPADLVAQLMEERPSECTPGTCLLLMASRRQKRMGIGEWSIVVSHGFASFRDVTVL